MHEQARRDLIHWKSSGWLVTRWTLDQPRTGTGRDWPPVRQVGRALGPSGGGDDFLARRGDEKLFPLGPRLRAAGPSRGLPLTLATGVRLALRLPAVTSATKSLLGARRGSGAEGRGKGTTPVTWGGALPLHRRRHGHARLQGPPLRGARRARRRQARLCAGPGRDAALRLRARAELRSEGGHRPVRPTRPKRPRLLRRALVSVGVRSVMASGPSSGRRKWRASVV